MMLQEDRTICVQPNEVVKSAWVDINCCIRGSHHALTPEAVEKKWRQLLNLGEAAIYPSIVGHWNGETFIVDDGNHEYVASLMLGRKKLFVVWLERLDNQ